MLSKPVTQNMIMAPNTVPQSLLRSISSLPSKATDGIEATKIELENKDCLEADKNSIDEKHALNRNLTTKESDIR